jgi:serine/threonine protein kinase
MSEAHPDRAGGPDAGRPPRDTPSRLARLHRLCDDQRRRWESGERPRVEDYLAQDPDLGADEELLIDLLCHEFLLAEERGDQPRWEDYRRRFPQYAAQLRLQEELHRGLATASGEGAAGPPLSVPTRPPEPSVQTSSVHLAETMTFPGPDGAGPPPDVPRVLGEYELLERLGAGGMGDVYRARHRRLNKFVALKLLPARLKDSADSVARFLREMKAVGGLDHPNLVEAHDAGEEGGVVYLALKLVEGEDLDRLVRRRGPLPVAEACDLTRQAALGLQYLHERGLVHRDLKPSNLMRTPDGVVKVLDLGLARWGVEAGAGAELTATGGLLGTPEYLAPEQARSAATADIRADLYGLGGTLFYLLTGRPPFAHRTGLFEKLEAHWTEEAPDVRSLRPEVPAAVAELVRRLLAKDPADRPQTPAEVADALAAIAGPSLSVPQPRSAAPLPGNRVRRWLPAGRRWRLGAVLVLAGLLGLAGWAWLGRNTPPAPDSSPLSETKAPDGTEPGPKPLSIHWQVFRLSADAPGRQQVGEKTFRVRLNDRVEVEAALSEPAYAYLIAFNPADKPEDREQLFPRDEAERQPEKRDRLSPDKRLRLDDGVGLQAFAVVASRRPLPPYAEWRKSQPPVAWRPTRATPGVVWLADGEGVRGLYDAGFDRAMEEAAGDKVVIRELARSLKRMQGVETVSVIGFAVDRAE